MKRFDEIEKMFAKASDINTSAEDLALLATEDDIAILIAVAKHPKTPAEVLIRLATNEKLPELDFNCHLRIALVHNPKTPFVALKALAKYRCTMYGVARHENATLDLIREMIDQYDNDEHIKEELKERLEACEDPEVFKKFADDVRPSIREIVAYSPNTPVEVRQKLANDVNIFVRNAATRKMRETSRIR